MNTYESNLWLLQLPYPTFQELWWNSFTTFWYWIGQLNALVEVNKFLIADLAKSQELLDRARVKVGDKKWVIPNL